MSFPSLSKEMDPWQDFMIKIPTVQHARTTTKLIEKTLDLFASTERMINDISKYCDRHAVNFGYIWTRVRAWLPLQLRLTAEQIFWDRGGGWRRYISGFGPIKGDSGFGAPARIKPTNPQRAAPIERESVPAGRTGERPRGPTAIRRAAQQRRAWRNP